MKKSKKIIIGAVLLGLVTGVGFYCARHTPSLSYEQTVERFGQVREGMTVEEAENLMGEPTSKIGESLWEYDFTSLRGFPKNSLEPQKQVVYYGSFNVTAEGLVRNPYLGTVND